MKNHLLILSAVLLAACNRGQQQPEAATDSTLNAAFTRYENNFLEATWKEYPQSATAAGYHAYDTVLVIPDESSRKSSLKYVSSQLDSLSKYDTSKLSDANLIDYYLIRDRLNSIKWEIKELKKHEWNPAEYNISETFALILNEHYAPLDTRIHNFYSRLLHVPEYYAAAKKQVQHPVPELTGLAIDQNRGGLSIFEKDLADSLHKSNIPPAEQKAILERAQVAAGAIRDYITWLTDFKNDAPRSFRLGEPFYSQRFAYQIQSSYTATQIYDSAVVRKHYLHGQMARISSELWTKYFGKTVQPTDTLVLIKRMIDTLSVQHVKPAEFQQAIEKQLPELVAFVDAKQLLYQDPSKPLVVRKEPAYMAGVAGASISSPGPYDKGGNTYYNVGSLDGWSKEKAESYLREYNKYILQILNIHEAIPGHYTQQVYANRSPSLIKSILSNGAMIEGWAVYTEQMMLDNGYGNNEPEMWLMWYKWHLRAVCNTILDYSVHAKNMSKEDAVKLLVNEAFQQNAEAEGKWKRVSVTSVQLTSYYTGYKEITDLREAYKTKMGTDYQLKVFNEKFLSYGNAPVKYIRMLMLK
jgi:uncharacterized protein (DUF885 family)